MGFPRGQGRSAWIRRTLIGAVLVVVAISFLTSSLARHLEPVRQVGNVLAAPAAAGTLDREEPEPPPCPPGHVAITRADVGVGDAARCLPVGGDEVEGSRVDPLYGRVATRLLGSIAGRAPGFAGNVTVICWSQED